MILREDGGVGTLRRMASSIGVVDIVEIRRAMWNARRWSITQYDWFLAVVI